MQVSFPSPVTKPIESQNSQATEREVETTPKALPFTPYLPTNEELSPLRRVFQTTSAMKEEFAKFLHTIFYQLDEAKVFALMEELLADPNKSDAEVYRELITKIESTKKRFSILSKLWSLFVLKSGLGSQAAHLMRGLRQEKFRDYAEIYDRRYVHTLRKAAQLPLDGKVIAVCDKAQVGLADRIQAGALFYPYKQHVPLNDSGCEDPLLHPEQTHRPLSDEVTDNSLDLVSCLGGLHHIPADRVEPFVASLHRKLRPGGVILLREHNIEEAAGTARLPREDLRAIAAVVHTFVNATDGMSEEVEAKEIRDFKSLDEWTQLMRQNGFTRLSRKALVLKDDPTENAMCAFIKSPANLEELKAAIDYRTDCTRPKEGTRATWIEWGNVRFSKQYAEYIQEHHAYAFDFIGHLRQHWQYFFKFLTESLADDEVRLRDLLFSDNMAMNLFILTATTIQCSISALTHLPSACIARWKHGEDWRNICDLTKLEEFEAKNEKEYARFIDHTPFYMYDYIGKVKEMWRVIWNSPESMRIKALSTVNGIVSSLSCVVTALICAPIRAFYTAAANQEPDTIKILIKDPENELPDVSAQWEREKSTQHDHNHKIEVIYSTPDGHKLISLPRYRPFTQICGYLSQTARLEILEIGSQKEISLDLLLAKGETTPTVEGARVVYEMAKLQDAKERRYVTYQVEVCALKRFAQNPGTGHIEYIHE